jgi:hypothetical protein
MVFAERDIDTCAHHLFFSSLRILNLREVTCERKPGVDVIENFSKFVKQVSKTVFLTLVGATEPMHNIFGLDLSR